MKGKIAAVALDGALSNIEATGIQGQPEKNGTSTINIEIVSGRFCIAHAQNPNDPEEIIILNAFELKNFATGRDEAWRLWNAIIQ